MSVKKTPEDFKAFSQEILGNVNRDVSRIDFLRDVLNRLLLFSECEAVEIIIKKQDRYIRCKTALKNRNSFQYSSASIINSDKETERKVPKQSLINKLQTDIVEQQIDNNLPNCSINGSFWTGNIGKDLNKIAKSERRDVYDDQDFITGYNSLALIPLFFVNDVIGCIQLAGKKREYFNEDDIKQYENLSHNLGIALINQRAHAALRERIKELTCLYSIAQVSERRDLSTNDILNNIVEFIPPAWQYPEIAVGRISINGQTFSTSGYLQNGQRQTADIIINGNRRGVVEVVYTEKKQNLDEGPFLREERHLIDTIARQIALIVEQKEAEENRLKLQDQIRHADRLATIGQLAAGVAHELNEPLGNILGLAQLIKKNKELPNIVSKDVDGIVNASLNAREVIKKLLLFARQTPYKKERVNLNNLINDSLNFFEARCAKEDIKLVRLLSPNLPHFFGDRSQLTQVLVNLVVNAIQAMPHGGKLTIETKVINNHILLIVEDSGIGMTEDVIKKIFIPFFTTKDVNEGTGLGLSVVHGIITAHKGAIKAESSVNKGSRFEIKLKIV